MQPYGLLALPALLSLSALSVGVLGYAFYDLIARARNHHGGAGSRKSS